MSGEKNGVILLPVLYFTITPFDTFSNYVTTSYLSSTSSEVSGPSPFATEVTVLLLTPTLRSVTGVVTSSVRAVYPTSVPQQTFRQIQVNLGV